MLVAFDPRRRIERNVSTSDGLPKVSARARARARARTIVVDTEDK
jgi:hypothetical protein